MEDSKLKKLVPPGKDGTGMMVLIVIGWVLTAAELMARFAVYFPMVLGALPPGGGSSYVELPLPSAGFGRLMGVVFTHAVRTAMPLPPLAGTLLLLYLLVKGVSNETAFRRGSRADYTLRRLPDRAARCRMAWGLPGIGIAGLAAIFLGMMFVCEVIYRVYLP